MNMQSVNSSTDRQKEKQTLINSLWESLFGVDIKKPPARKVDFNKNRRLYMVGLEDFSVDSMSDNKYGNLANKRKINDENANRKQAVKPLTDSGRRSLGHSERPKSKDTERKHKLRNEKISNKGDEKKLNLPKGFIPVTDKNKEILDKDKMRNRARDLKITDTNEFIGRELQQQSKVSFNLNHLPEDAQERSVMIAHVIERVDNLKKKMQDEKQKLDEKCKEQKKRSRSIRSSSAGETGESSSVKTIYWPKKDNNASEDPLLCHFSAVKKVSNNYIDPKLERLEKLFQMNKKPENIDKNTKNHDIKNEGKIENMKLDQSKNIEDCKIVKEVCPDRKLENIEKLAQTDLKHKSTYNIEPHSASDTSVCSSRVKNNQIVQPALADNKLIKVMPDIECDDDDNKKESDQKNRDADKEMSKEIPTLEMPSRQVDVDKLEFGVFNVEIKNDDISTLFIMESNLNYDKVNMRRKETKINFLAGDGSGERGIMKSSCEEEKQISDEAKHNVSTELEQNSAPIATSYSENTKSKLIQSFMESHESVMNTLPPSNNDTVNNNYYYEVNTCNEDYYDSLTGENNMIFQTNDFYKQDNRIEQLSPDNESTIPDNLVSDIYRLKSYIPASQRITALKARYVPRLVSLSFYMQMASCFKIVAQFDKSLTCETFSNQENSMLKKRIIQFAEYPELDYSLSVFSDSNFSENEELILDVQDDLLTEDELEIMCDKFQNQEILDEDIENKVENSCCYGEVQLSKFANNEIESPNTLLTTISNPVYVVIMEANEKHSSSFGKAEICKIESSRFSEIILNEISGVNKRLVIGSELQKLDKTDKNHDVQRKNKSIISNDKSGKRKLVPSQSREKVKGRLIPSQSREKVKERLIASQSREKVKERLIPSQSREKIKLRASSVCLPSGMNKYHTKRNTTNQPRVTFSQSNVVINRPKMNSQVAVGKQCSNVAKEEVPSTSRVAKVRSSSLEPPEYLNSQLISIREEIRELKNLFAKR